MNTKTIFRIEITEKDGTKREVSNIGDAVLDRLNKLNTTYKILETETPRDWQINHEHRSDL